MAPLLRGKWLFFLVFVRRNKTGTLPASLVLSPEGTLEARKTGPKTPPRCSTCQVHNSAAVLFVAVWFLSFAFRCWKTIGQRLEG
ncbi:hypothetical protein [Rhizobium rhizogenes]|uniref:hypothetical protein n=1 Tax=Rhizobium rhizogenes TaxID=359 RepID=UPI00122F3A5D|nr:hypothetical protein [Rhizobium rhizogenes]